LSCGEEFHNFPRDWDNRIEHLTHVHKFGECNQTKKFYRADHFRQHLKYSHAGTSGKWMNMLETAGMKDELSSDVPAGTIIEAGEANQSTGQTAAATTTAQNGHPPSTAPSESSSNVHGQMVMNQTQQNEHHVAPLSPSPTQKFPPTDPSSDASRI
jgi:hypothetical protein